MPHAYLTSPCDAVRTRLLHLQQLGLLRVANAVIGVFFSSVITCGSPTRAIITQNRQNASKMTILYTWATDLFMGLRFQFAQSQFLPREV